MVTYNYPPNSADRGVPNMPPIDGTLVWTPGASIDSGTSDPPSQDQPPPIDVGTVTKPKAAKQRATPVSIDLSTPV